MLALGNPRPVKVMKMAGSQVLYSRIWIRMAKQSLFPDVIKGDWGFQAGDKDGGQ